ncbi:MAG: N-acetylmuramoyl-L-alanine amidase [Paracoccaceae bacterium]
MRKSGVIIAGALAMLLATPVLSQGFSGLARVLPDEAAMTDTRRGARIDLPLSQGVPYRVFTLDDPARLVMDFQEVDWSGLQADNFDRSERLGPVHFGAYVPGWSRLVTTMSEPMVVETADLRVDDVTGEARLILDLQPVSAEDFATQSGAPHDARWDLPAVADVPERAARPDDAPLIVMLDPGHGGIDPGAEQGEIVEKDLMLTFARELREVMLRSGGFEVVLTRDGDHFVSLERRVALAHQSQADVFISLHADSLSEGLAHGATVHILSEDASDIASEKLAERHDRGDLLSGVDLSDTDDAVTGILLDLARTETRPRTEQLAGELVNAMAQTGGPMNRRPLRSAAFSVLKSADIPSVLIEIGFLSSPRDFKNLTDPAWRLTMAEAIRNGLLTWKAADDARRPLVRQ